MLAIALVARERRAGLSAAAWLLWYTADCAHIVGHIVSSQAVGAPMDAVDFGIYPKSVYLDDDVSPRQHIGRAAGGVAASLIAALALAALARIATPPLAKQVLTIAAFQHGLLCGLSMLPLPMVDGGVIYANLPKLGR
jgi:membrane-associated PAP2 superfamily phosphatase